MCFLYVVHKVVLSRQTHTFFFYLHQKMARSFKLRSNKVPNVFHTRLQGKHVLENGKLHIYIYCEKNYF